MTRSKAIKRTLILLSLAPHLGMVGAVCLNPQTGVSGYKLPLPLETREAEAIVIGRAISEQPLQEDPADPDGVTAYHLTIQVQVRLKGNLPDVFVIRNENTSARYPFSLGEEHLLFVSRSSEGLRVNSCGNSSAMPDAHHLLKQIEIQLEAQE